MPPLRAAVRQVRTVARHISGTFLPAWAAGSKVEALLKDFNRFVGVLSDRSGEGLPAISRDDFRTFLCRHSHESTRSSSTHGVTRVTQQRTNL